jgi:pyruvate/2-oxoglutarate dehydrogenase complex dihydrolipoamide dehydrogenase (E3) component
MTPTSFDLVVLGGGSAGYAAARTAASAGLSVAIVEGGKEVGGLCILRGCMPTKALLYAAEVLHLAKTGNKWGLEIPQAGLDFKAVMAHKATKIAEFASFRREQLSDGRFTLVRADARFVDPHTVELSDGSRLTGSHFFVATGSVVSAPPLPQLRESGYLTSDDALALEILPKSLIVLGGGAVAVEFAQMFQRFGVEVTLVQRSEHLLKDFDTDAAEAIEATLREEGMRVLCGTRLMEARRTQAGKEVVIEQHGKVLVLRAEEILLALGRSPNTHRLNLGAAGVQTDDHGKIVTDDSMRTTTPHIYAGGDCTSPFEIVHLAVAQAEVAGHNIVHPDRRRTMDYRLIMSVVFTDPQVAAVGLTEKTAKSKGIPYIAASYPFNDHGKSIIMEVEHGAVKLLADPKTGEILGGSVVGPAGGELIHEIVVAMAARMTVAQLAAVPHYHPTLAEIWTYPAEELAEQVG